MAGCKHLLLTIFEFAKTLQGCIDMLMAGAELSETPVAPPKPEKLFPSYSAQQALVVKIK
jgi:hypothetical protein